jgi:spermidine synthase
VDDGAIRVRLAFLTVFVVAACGLGYELTAASVGSYLLGDSVTQFSLTIGLYLFAMGVGSWLSRYVRDGVADRFVDIELAVALVGGTSAAALFFAYGSGRWFRPVLYGEILLVGTMVGLEIPLLMRLLKDQLEFGDLVAKVLSFDYVGALIVSLAFPLLLVPRLGLVRTSLLLGLLNAAVGLWSTWIFAPQLRGVTGLRVRGVAVIVILLAGLASADRLTSLSEEQVFADEVVFSKNTPYQRIVVTSNAAGFQLFLNGALQFSSVDEYRYHEALVHPVLASVAEPRRVLVLGGGDGLAVREVLRNPMVEKVTLVDIDPAMTGFARTFPPLRDLNKGALDDPRVTLVHDDAMAWLAHREGTFDVVICDFPDPSSFSLGKLYSTRFYERLLAVLAPDGAVAVQATSPLLARRSFWCIVRTLEATGLSVRPYHTAVPAFGEWGFALAARRELPVPAKAPAGLRFLDDATLESLFVLGPDMGPVEMEPNRLNNQVLVRTYEEEWRQWN